MNPGARESQPQTDLPPATNWSRKKFVFLITFAFAAHVAFISLLGAKKPVAPRVVKNVPIFHLADPASEFLRLTDPTLFVLPHAEDSAGTALGGIISVEQFTNRWTEPPQFLDLAAGDLGATFSAFMRTNQFVTTRLDFKPSPPAAVPTTAGEAALPQNSNWQLTGELAGRRLLHPLTLPLLPVNDVLPPSRVQLLVAADGNVFSTALLDTSGNPDADQNALALARTLRFAPARKLMFGEITFLWHTVPVATP